MVRKAIVDLFLNVKIRSQEQIAGMTEEAIEKEKHKLLATDTVDILDYIKQSIEILMHMRMDEFDVFKRNWETQERIKKYRLQREKEELKCQMNQGHRKNKSRILEKVRQEMIENSEMSSTSSLQNMIEDQNAETEHTRKLLSRQTVKYEKIMHQLESDIRQHIRVEQ